MPGPPSPDVLTVIPAPETSLLAAKERVGPPLGIQGTVGSNLGGGGSLMPGGRQGGR